MIDNPKGSGPSSKWAYTTSGLKGHDKAISQTRERGCANEKGCYATMLLLKIFRFYDFKIKVSVNMESGGIVGIMFRVEDMANYYVFEMKAMEYKRVRRVVKGQSSIVAFKKDGGFQQNTWYRVYIQSLKDKFIIRMFEESKAGDEESMPIVIEFEDQYIAQGRMGFMTNKMSAFYFDKLTFEPIKCITENMVKLTVKDKIPYELPRDYQPPSIFYKPPQCSRFHLNYKLKLDLMWKQYNHESLSRGPPVWKYKKKLYDRENVLVQEAKIYSASPDQPGAILYLDYQRICKNGVVNVQFNAQDDGYVAVLFRMKNKYNYYMLQINGEIKKEAKLKKVINGKHQLLSVDEKEGYIKNKWHNIQILMSKDILRFYFSQHEGPVGQLFGGDIKDEEFSEGSIGVSSFLTSVAFDEISMYPQLDIPEPKEDLTGEPPATSPIDGEDIKQQQGQSKEKEGDNNKNHIKKEEEEKEQEQEKISFEECLINKDQVTRFDYCETNYGFDIGVKDNCKADYCGTCCDKIVDMTHKIQNFECKKECNAGTVETQLEKPYANCIESPMARKSVFNYCKFAFQDEASEKQCSQGLCDLCCITVIKSNNLEIADEVVEECHAECQQKYGFQDSNALVISPESPIAAQVDSFVQQVVVQ